MVTASAQALQERVLARLDEVTPQGSKQSVPPGIVQGELQEAAEDVLSFAPRALALEAARPHSVTLPSVGADDESVTFRLEADTIRVLSVQLSSWAVPVREKEIIADDSDAHLALMAGETEASNRYPAAVMTVMFSDDTKSEQVGRLALQCWPVEENESLKDLKAIPRLDYHDVPDVLVDAMVWQAAGRVAEGYLKDYEAGQAAKANSQSSLQQRLARAGRHASRPTEKKTTRRNYNILG